MRGIGLIEPLQMREVDRAGESPAAALTGEREAWFRVEGELRELADQVLRPRSAGRRATGSTGRP